MNITGTARTDLKALKALNTAAMCRKSKPAITLIKFPAIITLMLVILILLKLFVLSNLTLVLIYFVAVFGYAYSGLLFYIYFGMPKKQLKTFEKQGGLLINKYLFDATGFVVNGENESGSVKSTGCIEYSSLLSVIETKEYLLLQNSNKTYYIVEKSTLVGNDGDQLQVLLKSMFPQKYTINKYI